jgi:hypothetical protein
MLRALRSAILITAAALSSAAMAGDVDQSHAALAAAFKNVKGTLESGLKAGERVGRPISAEFALEDGTLQLFLWIAKDDGFSEIILYPAISMITEIHTVADADKHRVATAQKLVLESATVSLLSATESAVKANNGFRAVSASPLLSAGRPIAMVTLLGPDGFRVVTEKLYRVGF